MEISTLFLSKLLFILKTYKKRVSFLGLLYNFHYLPFTIENHLVFCVYPSTICLYNYKEIYFPSFYTKGSFDILNVLNFEFFPFFFLLREFVITIHRESPLFSCMLFHCMEALQFNQSPSDI